MEQKRSSQVKSIRTLVSNSKSDILILLMNWSDIVGKGNSKLMIPLKLSRKILEIALPNNMVLSIASRFASEIIKKVNIVLNCESVVKLKFVLKPELFKKTTLLEKKVMKNLPEISEEEIVYKKQELIDKFGLDANIAESAARIELLNIKRME